MSSNAATVVCGTSRSGAEPEETMALEGYRSLSFERPRDGVLLVLLDRPEQLNATDAVMHSELARVWRDIADDTSSRAVVLAGRGRAFCAGGDLDLIAQQAGNFDLVVIAILANAPVRAVQAACLHSHSASRFTVLHPAR